MTYRTTIFISAGVLIAGAVGYHIYQNVLFQNRPDEPAVAVSPLPEVKTGDSTKFTTEELPLPEQDAASPNVPQLRRPVVFSAAFSAEAREIVGRKIEASIAALEKNPQSFEEWMNLAILRKTVDDYEGARQIWEFLTKLLPNQPGPYANLASLYAFELKDPLRAEKNFSEAIEKGPKEISVYRNAYDFYRYAQKDDEKAKEMLRKGIAETQSSDLQYLLEHYAEL